MSTSLETTQQARIWEGVSNAIRCIPIFKTEEIIRTNKKAKKTGLIEMKTLLPEPIAPVIFFISKLIFYYLQAVISIIMLIPDSSKFGTLVGLFSFASWVFYGSCFCVLLYLRYSRRTMIRPYKVFTSSRQWKCFLLKKTLY